MIVLRRFEVRKLKKYISGITKASAFEWYASLVLSHPTPSNDDDDLGFRAPAITRSCGAQPWEANSGQRSVTAAALKDS